MLKRSQSTTYVECTKKGHDGQIVNVICNEYKCRGNPLCCYHCVDEDHRDHKTQTITKILMEANEVLSRSKIQNEEQPTFDASVFEMIKASETKSLKQFHNIRRTIQDTMDEIQKDLLNYYHNLEQMLKSQGGRKISQKLEDPLEGLRKANNVDQLLVPMQKLLFYLQISKGAQKKRENHMSTETLKDLIGYFNTDVEKISERVIQIKKQLQKNKELISEFSVNIKKLFSIDYFSFSPQLKKDSVIVSQNIATTKKDAEYQIALMDPALNKVDGITAFKFYIKKLQSNWLGIGMAHKNIVISKKFKFEHSKLGHGCYMVSSNRGSWSSLFEQKNNKVKAFYFTEGDTVTCIVNSRTKEIFFIKDYNQADNQPTEIYQLSYTDIMDDQLHPAVVFYYAGTEIQYRPVINIGKVPKYEYLFTEEHHPNLNVINGRSVISVGGKVGYRAALLNKCLQSATKTNKTFSFHIGESYNNWIALGMCYRKTVIDRKFQFKYSELGHGYYMVSSNAGTWSSIDKNKNNLVKAFYFRKGDVVRCEVIFANKKEQSNKIVFRKGKDTYELEFELKEDDELYPCVVLYFDNDQINLVPTF